MHSSKLQGLLEGRPKIHSSRARTSFNWRTCMTFFLNPSHTGTFSSTEQLTLCAEVCDWCGNGGRWKCGSGKCRSI